MSADVLSIYGNPIWSNDSSKLFYEVISTPSERPLSGNFRDVGIFYTDVNSDNSREIELIGWRINKVNYFFKSCIFNS